MKGDTDLLELFANRDIDAPIFAHNFHLVENQYINALSLEDGVDEPNGLLNT